MVRYKLTVVSRAIRLDVSSGDLAVYHLERISLAARSTEDGSAVKVKLESLGESTGGVAEEADLYIGIVISSGSGMHIF